MKNYIIISLLFLFAGFSHAQKVTISGTVKDASSGEDLLYASISILSEGTGVTTNEYGFYSLTIPKGEYSIVYSYVGYEPIKINLELDQDVEQNIELFPSGTQLDEIIVTSKKDNENITNTESGVVTLDVLQAKKIPVIFGEQDILKTLQLMPGVSANSEGGSGFFVRGGNIDQNLILLDEAPVYNASHLLGFFSVFNSDAIKDIKLYKGGIPAQFGGRASSVLDLKMKEGNSKKWGAAGGIGLIASRLTVEGPIQKDKGSIVVSGRRTYADVAAKLYSSEFSDLSLFFYDLNLKANYSLGKKDRIFLSGYLGRDKFGVADFGFDWGNTTVTARWNHIFNNKLFLNTSFIYSDYDYGFDISQGETDINLNAGIYDYNLKQDYTYFLNPNNKLKFGIQGIYHDFKPTSFSFDGNPDDSDVQTQQALEAGIYLSNLQKVNSQLSFEYGFRVSSFSNIGDYTEQILDEEEQVVEEIEHSKGEFYNNYFNFEPRVNATYQLDANSSLKASYNRNNQYLHLIQNSNSGTPTDTWIPSSAVVAPTIADQVSLGYFRNFAENKFKFSTEVYYKWLDNIVDYKDGAETFGASNIETELVNAEGKAYGAEFLLEKTQGKLTGWVGYTLSKSLLKSDEVNDGNWYSARQDRTHDISVVGIYDLTRKLSISASWVYNTGDAVTFPTGGYQIGGEFVNLYTNRNADRMPDYHRLDLGVTWKIKESKSFSHDLNVSFYNVYNRKNAYTITFGENAQGSTEATRLALFGIVPSVSWNFKF